MVSTFRRDSMDVCFLTDRGMSRSQNQDAVFATTAPVGSLENLFIVADGMGGHNAGDYASQKAIEIILEIIARNIGAAEVAIQRGITIANAKIYEEAQADEFKRGMGTTVVLATTDAGLLRVANVGDSRLYTLSEAGLEQITLDHSIIEEMVRRGEVSKEVAAHHPKRNFITRAVGAEPAVEVDFFQVPLEGVKSILLCSDGLTNMVEENEIAHVLAERVPAEQKANRLIEMANKAGGHDNISVIIIDI